MSLKFKKPWVQYSEPKQMKLGKSVTVSGQSLPMSQIVMRYMSGQIFGISSFSTSFDFEGFESDLNIADFENSFIPDPADPLAYERALQEHSSLQASIKARRDNKDEAKESISVEIPPKAEENEK